jgi:transposase
MGKRKGRHTRQSVPELPSHVAKHSGQTLTSHAVGVLPIINRILKRMRFEEILKDYLPREDGRTKLPTSRTLLVLLKNILISREPIYGVGEWASGWAPDVLGLSAEELSPLNDDRVGRCLEKLFDADHSSLALAMVSHVVKEFGVQLQRLHNDSTTISFFGAYDQAGRETRQRGLPTLAITWGHSKDHRPDLKQLLYILTISGDGAVPVYFTAASGNVTDDTTHRDTWDLLCQLTGRRDFLYVADCKLGTTENMKHVAGKGGRFITVLARNAAGGRGLSEAACQRGDTLAARVRQDGQRGRNSRPIFGMRRVGDQPRGFPTVMVSQYAKGRVGRGCPHQYDRSSPERTGGTPPEAGISSDPLSREGKSHQDR